MREQLFSVHTHSDGSVALYLEEQDAVKDLVSDIAGSFTIQSLDELRAIGDENVKAEGHFERLDTARDNLGEGAPLLANMTHDEALSLAYDLVIAVKLARLEEVPQLFEGLKVVR